MSNREVSFDGGRTWSAAGSVSKAQSGTPYTPKDEPPAWTDAQIAELAERGPALLGSAPPVDWSALGYVRKTAPSHPALTESERMGLRLGLIYAIESVMVALDAEAVSMPIAPAVQEALYGQGASRDAALGRLDTVGMPSVEGYGYRLGGDVEELARCMDKARGTRTRRGRTPRDLAIAVVHAAGVVSRAQLRAALAAQANAPPHERRSAKPGTRRGDWILLRYVDDEAAAVGAPSAQPDPRLIARGRETLEVLERIVASTRPERHARMDSSAAGAAEWNARVEAVHALAAEAALAVLGSRAELHEEAVAAQTAITSSVVRHELPNIVHCLCAIEREPANGTKLSHALRHFLSTVREHEETLVGSKVRAALDDADLARGRRALLAHARAAMKTAPGGSKDGVVRRACRAAAKLVTAPNLDGRGIFDLPGIRGGGSTRADAIAIWTKG